MQHLVHPVGAVEELEAILNQASNIALYHASSAVLIQLYSSAADDSLLKCYIHKIKELWPAAEVIGGSSSAEIISGRSLKNQTLFSALCFQHSTFKVIEGDCFQADQPQYMDRFLEYMNGHANPKRDATSPIKGLMLLTTPLSCNVADLVGAMRSSLVDTVVFGGGLGRFSEGKPLSKIFHNERMRDHGFLAVAFYGEQLEIHALNHLGWRAFSQTMTITKCQGNTVFEVDGKPAFDLYHKYLEIENNEDFESNTGSFPFLISRGSNYLARVPICVGEKGSLQFYASMNLDDQFKIGYADPQRMIISARDLQDEMASYRPEALLLFSCDSRLNLLTKDVDLETYPFDMIAPTAGFFTVGEYCGSIKSLETLNSAFVAVGFKENAPDLDLYEMGTAETLSDDAEKLVSEELSSEERPLWAYWQWRKGFTDAMINKTVVVKDPQAVSRLVQYISVVTAELEATNQALEQLSIIDKLTQLYNRMKLDEIMAQEIVRAKRYGSTFAVIMMDVDYFKAINDQYGHLIGDQVLVEVGQLLKSLLVRETDILGRWGGEEFLIILPENELDQAIKLAWKLKMAVSDHEFVLGIKRTCSFGATSYQASDTEDSILNRADQALLRAKELGRNRVEFA